MSIFGVMSTSWFSFQAKIKCCLQKSLVRCTTTKQTRFSLIVALLVKNHQKKPFVCLNLGRTRNYMLEFPCKLKIKESDFYAASTKRSSTKHKILWVTCISKFLWQNQSLGATHFIFLIDSLEAERLEVYLEADICQAKSFDPRLKWQENWIHELPEVFTSLLRRLFIKRLFSLWW